MTVQPGTGGVGPVPQYEPAAPQSTPTGFVPVADNMAKKPGAPKNNTKLFIIIGGAVVAVGLWWIWTGATERFAKKLDPRVDRKVLLAGRVGHAARGFAFTVLGVLVALAALRSDPDQAGGTDTALVTILGWPAGPVLVGAIAVGLMLFGVFHVLAARHVVKD